MTVPVHRHGRWYVFKNRDPFDPAHPWTVLLWGGNGEHWADGAEMETFADAIGLARMAANTHPHVIRRRYMA